MTYFIQQLINGLSIGFIYSIVGIALVLIYRTSGIVNFAQGEMAVVSALVAWQLTAFGFSIYLSAFIAVVLGGLLGALIYYVLVRPVERKDELTIVSVTIGVLLAINSVNGTIWGFTQKAIPNLVELQIWSLGGVKITSITLLYIGSLVILSGVVYLILQKTKFGLGIRACADNSESSRLVGINYKLIMTIGWALSAMLGGFAAIVIGGQLSIDPNMMMIILIFAFASIMVGGIRSYIGAVVGGVLVGVTQTMSNSYLPIVSGDLQVVLPLALIIIVIIIKPNGLFGKKLEGRV